MKTTARRPGILSLSLLSVSLLTVNVMLTSNQRLRHLSSSSSSSSFSSSASTTSSLSTEPLLECFDATTETTFRVPFSQFYNSSFLIETDARDTSTRTKRKRKRKRKRKEATPLRCRHDFRNSTVFFHVGKAGGGTFQTHQRAHRLRLRPVHPSPSSRIVDRLVSLDASSPELLVVNVRDPIDRFVSAFRWRLLRLCSPDDERERGKRGGAAEADRRCKISEELEEEERMLRATYRSDPNVLAEALCDDGDDGTRREKARRDMTRMGHSATLREWLDFLVGDHVSGIPTVGLREFWVVPLETPPGADDEPQFERHVDRLLLSLLRSKYGRDPDVMRRIRRTFDEVNTTVGVGSRHSAADYYYQDGRDKGNDDGDNDGIRSADDNTRQTPFHNLNSNTKQNSNANPNSNSTSAIKPAAAKTLSPLGECCLARYYLDDYRLIQTMLFNPEDYDTRHDAASTTKMIPPILPNAHPVLQRACSWGENAHHRYLCQRDLKSMIERRAKYLDVQQGSCRRVVKGDDADGG